VVDAACMLLLLLVARYGMKRTSAVAEMSVR